MKPIRNDRNRLPRAARLLGQHLERCGRHLLPFQELPARRRSFEL
ncbi:hypothetical protein FHT77_005422 [Rhizobium sp. BK181]|nr:hypothetical protein [Rhizobium sp. BK181]